MNVFCVNKSHKDFKKLSKELDIHEDQLNDIIYKYENDNQVDTFPSKEYIENQLRGDNQVTSQDQYGIWLNKYSEPKVFDSKEEANSYIEEAKRLFPAKEAIVTKRKVNGQIEVTIGRPYDKNDITSQLMHHLNTYEGIEVGNSTELGNYLQENGYTSIQEAIEAEKEMQEIKAKAIANSTFMKVPNGKSTNLNERQWLQVRTKNFIRWFGDWINDPANASKVVDENGEPLVVYHGSKVTDIRIFKKDDYNSGYYFTSDINYAKSKFGNEIYQIFLNIKNPLDLRLTYNKDEGGAAYYKGRKLNLHEQAEMELNHKNVDSGAPYYMKEGYDGIFGNDSVDTAVNGEEQIASEGTEYVVWNPNQIKSATDNNGMFSTENDDIQMFIGKKARTKFAAKEHGVTIQTEALNITGNKFKNSLYRGQGYAPVIDAEGNLHLHTNYDSLSKLKTLSFDSTIEGAEHYGNRSARHPYIIEIDEDFLDTILPKEDYDRDKVNRGESFRYNEEFNEVRLSFKDELIIPKGKFNITQTNETLRLEDFDDIMSSIGWLQSLEERSEIEEYNGASELTGRIHENDLKSLGKALKNTLGTYKGYDVITILYDVLALQNDVPGSPIGPSNQYKEFINKGLIETEDLNGYTYYRPSKALIEHLTKKLGLRKTSKTSQSIFPQSSSTPSTPPTPFAHFAPSNDYGDLPFFRTPQGEIYGFVGKDNKIYLDEHIISPEHPIHEYTHLWDRVVAKRNPKLWKRGIELMKKTSLWKQYANDPNYGLKWKATEGMTTERFEDLVASEVHARLVGKEGEALLTQLAKEKGSKNIIEKLKSWLLDVWRELKSTFSNWSQEDINKLTLEDFNNMTLRDFVNKVNLDTNSLQRSLNEEYYAEREDFNKQLGEENTRTDTEKALNNWFEWGKEQAETASNQTLSKEAQKHINRCQVYKKQVEELSKSFKKSEIQTLSTSIANRVSSIISEIEENPNLIKDYFNLERSELSETPTREEIINKIGIDNLYRAIANKYFGNVKSFSKKGKVIKIQRNFQILMLLSNPILSKNEGIQVDFNFTKKDVEYVLASFDENDEANENSATSQESWQNNIRTVSVENMMLPKIRRLLSNLPLIKNGEQIKDEWGIPQTVSLREAIGTILNAIGGKAKDHKQMASLLTQYIEDSKNTWLQPIVDILNDTTGKYETEQSLLYKDFCKNSLKFSVSGKDFISHVIDSKQDYAFSRIKQTFGSKLWVLQNKTDNKVNKEELNKLLELATVNKLKTKEGIKQLYEAFGIYLSNLDAERIVSLGREESLVTTIRSIYVILKEVNEEFTPFDRNSDSGISSYLHTLLEPYVKITSEGFTSTVVSEGKRYQQFVLPSFLSKFNSIIQNSSEEDLVNWMMNTYGNVEWYKLSDTNDTEDIQGSVADGWRNPILQLLATDPNFRKNFDWTQSLGYREEKLYQFMRTMSPLQCFKMQLNMFNATDGRKGDIIPAWYAVPLMANKPSAEFIKLNRYRGDNYKATILGLLAPMFIKEVYRIKLVRDRKNYIKEHPEKEIQNFDKRGDKFCNFEMFNDVSESSKKIIEDFIEGKASVEELSNMFNSEMTKYLDSRVTTNSMLLSIQSTALENFYWNNFLAKMSMEDLFLGDSAFYKNVVDKVKRALQLHSSGQRPNTSATWNKKPVSDGKHRAIVLSSFKEIKSNIISNLKEVFAKRAAQFTGEDRNAFEAYADSIIKQYEEVDVTDGQAYTTISGYRKKAIMFGKWSREAEEVYNRLKNGEVNLSVLKQAFPPLKPFQYSQTKIDLSNNGNNGQIASNVSSTLVPSQYKTAEYLLIMADALLQGNEKNNILKAITDIIEDTHNGEGDDYKKGIDTVLFDSSVKEGNSAVIDISTLIKEGKTAGDIKTEINNKISGYKQDANNPYVKVTPFEDYMIQQELPPHFKDHYQSFPTQARYLAITDLLSNFNGEEVLFTIGDKSYTVKELQQEWEKTWKEEVDYGTDKLLKELAITSGNKAERNVRLSKLLVNSLLDSSKMNMETFESILVDENGEFQMPIDDPALATTVMPLIFSAVKSRVNKQTAAGGPIVQVSSFGTSKKLNIRFKDKSGKLLPTREGWENSKNKSHKSYNDFIKENQAGVAYMEVYASVPSDEIFNAFRDKKGNIDINAINRVNPGLLEMIGVRIPTEGKLSMWPMKIVGFLPYEAGEAIMLPEEITKITGSDFDSDKQYIIRKALSVVERTAENKKEKVINYLLEQNKNYTREFVEKAYDEYMENPENYKDSEDVHWEVENALSKSHIKYAARAIGDHNKRRNHIFDMMMAVLQHESVADQLLTPQGFEQLKTLAAEINGVSDFSELQNDPTNLTDLATYLNYYNLNKEGGQMLGIFASQKIAHAVLSMDNYHLLISGLEKTPFKLGGQVYRGLIAIDPQYNKEGTLIGEILGSCVGASADVTKDPVLPYLGINSYNINVFITGVRLGIPLKPLVQLLNHPALKALYAKKNNGETKSLKSLVSKELNKQLEKAGFEKEGRNSEMFMSKDALETDLTALNAFLTLIYCSETVDALSKKTRLNSTTDSATVGPYFGDFLYKDKVLSNQVPEVYDEEGNFVDANDTFYKNHPMLEALYNAFPIIKKIFKDTSLGNQLNVILEEGLRTTGVEILKNQGLATKFIKFYQSQLLFYLNQSDPNKGISIKKVADGYYDTFAKNFNKIKESYKDNQLIKTIKIEIDNKGEATLLIPNLDDLGREEVNALRAAWEDLAVDAPEVARDLFEWNAVKGGLTFNPNTFVHLAGNNVRSLIPGYKEAFDGNADFNISKIYDDFIVKYWRQLMLPRLTPKIKAEKSYKYVTYKGFLYKLNDSGEYMEVNTNIPVYQQLSELMDENKSESQEGIEYQNDLYASEEVEISDNSIAVDALDSSIREESSNYQKYNKDVENHIEMTEEEKEDLNDELDKYC